VGSSLAGISLTGSASAYVPVGDAWDALRHHTLAFHLGAGVSDGDATGPGAFSLGGFTATALATTLQNVLVQGGVALRGYDPFSISGRNFALLNSEYRFPIANLDRGVGAYPVFARRITGAFFMDAGTATTMISNASLRVGSGAELWVDTTSGYFVDLLFRLGAARGWNEGGVWQFYGVATTVY
jgi:outer membrane protein assembly factor BamA